MMHKLNGLVVVLAVLMMAGSAMASLDIDGTPWDLEFDGTGAPSDQGWTQYGYNSATYNDDYKIGTGATAGWLTANGNSGGIIASEGVGNGLTKAAGWTVEWSFLAANNTSTVANVIYIDDDVSSGARIDISPGTVTLRDGWVGTSDSVAVDMSSNAVHVFRLVRQAGSETVELYVDNDFSSPAAQVTLFNPTGDNNNRVYWGGSAFESSWDYFRFHSGATIPEPASLALIGLGGLMMLSRRKA